MSNYGPDVLSEVPHSETYLNDMENQSVHAMQDFEQTPVVDVTDNEITSDSNIISYSQYLQETQQANVQDTNLQAQQDSMILSVIEQMSEQMINHVNNWEKANKEQNNESVTAELERYKERVKTFEQRLNIDLSSREKMIDSQMDDMIKEKLALKEQVDSLEQNLSKQIKEKECLLQTFTVFKNESKEKENKYMENEIDLKKKIKELDNIIFKVVEIPSELPKVSLVNASLKKLKLHLVQFDSVVKKRTTPDARTEGECGFEHTKVIFNNEIIPFLKSLKDILNVFDKDLLNEIMEVQTVFNQMEVDVQQSSVDKQCLEIAKKELLLENDRLLQQIMSQDVILTMINSMSLNGESVNIERKRNESCDKCFNLDVELLKSQNAHNDFLKSYSQLEKHYISLELSIQLNQEIFQKHESCDNQNALEIPEFFENNDLKTQLQDKDTTICKLKEIIKSIREKFKEENVNYDYCEIETKNVELENSVAKLLSENERLCKEINHVKKLDLDPLAPRLLQDKEAHIDYLKYTQEQDDILQGIELLVYVRDTCPNAIKLSAKKVVVTPKNNVKKVRFAEPLTSSSNIKQVESSTTSDSNTHVLSPTGLKCSTSNCRSKPTCNKKNDRISRTPSRNMKNKVEAQPRKVNKKNRVVEPIRDVDVKHSLLKANSELICATCKKSMFDGVHDMCLLDFVENVNSRAKSAKKHKKQNIWKPTGHVFTEVGLKWKPTGRTFTIVGNSCPLTRITSANVVPPKKTTSHSVETQKPELKVYSKKPKNVQKLNIDIPSSSSLIMTSCPDCSLVSGLRMFKTYDREPLSAHELLLVNFWVQLDSELAFARIIG
ncbi:hypothetical protein Tco_0138498 [Tanacetum coccineum]